MKTSDARLYFLNALAFAAALIMSGCLKESQTRAKAQAPSPNIVLIFTDDQGYGDVGCYGAQGFRTPNLDRLAEQGMRFTDFYVNCPVCSGSRAALLTGCHYQRVSVPAVLFPRNRNGLHPDEITVAEVLKTKGYATACIGKWHLGHLEPFLPTRQGFDYYFGIPYSNDMWLDAANAKLAPDINLREGMTRERIRTEKYKRNWVPLMRGEEVIEYPADQTTLTKRYTEEAVRFIAENKDRPFFLYLPHSMPHLPMAVSPAFKGRTETLFGDVMEEIDWSVGEILKALDQHGLTRKTLVIFTTDNGTKSGSSGPLRAKKGSIYEGGIRVPCIMRWPGRIPAGRVCSEVAATIDILPTLAYLTGAEVPSDRIIDGKNIWPLMRGDSGAKSPHEAYCLAHGGGAVRSGKWKFYPTGVRKRGRRRRGQARPVHVQPPKAELYDLSADLSEITNVAEKHPDVVKRLLAVYRDHINDLRANKRPAGTVEPKQ